MREVSCAFFGKEEKAKQLSMKVAPLEKWVIHMETKEDKSEFLAGIQKEKFELLFLDTSLDWLGVIQEIRLKKFDIPVVLLTKDYKSAVKGYEFQVFRCLKEPVALDRLVEVLENYEIQDKAGRRILLRTGKNQFVNIFVNQIYYASIEDRGCNLYLLEDKIWTSTHLSELEKQLPNQFCRCHNSFLVNLDMVMKICRYTITLIDGREVPVSKQKYNIVKEKLWFHESI